MAVEIFNIEWTKLQPFDTALNQSASKEGGIYFLFKKTTGGIGKPVYIGMSQDFYKRFGTHRNNASHLMTDSDIKKHFVTFGIVTAFKNSCMTHDITSEQLHQIESYFINRIQSEGNSASTKKGYKGSPIIIFNHGLAGLPKAMSDCDDLIKLLKSKLT